MRIMAILVMWFGVVSALAASEFHDWTQAQRSSFASFREEQDAAYARYLAEEWQAFEQFQGEFRDPVPKPAEQPVMTAVGTASVVPRLQRVSLPDVAGFYGHQPRLPECRFSLSWQGKADAGALAEAWQILNRQVCSGLPEAIQSWVKQHQLGDLGLWRLSHWMAQQQLLVPESARPLLVWVLLMRCGVDARLAHTQNTLRVLVPVRHQVYGAPYVIIQGERFYQLGSTLSGDASVAMAGRLLMPARMHPQSSRGLSFDFSHRPALPRELRGRELRFVWAKKEHRLTVDWDMALARWYVHAPQLPLSRYFSARHDALWKNSLSRELARLTAGLKPVESVNLVLALVQQSLPYVTDELQFGQETYLLPEQVFAYAGADCEDRALLFAAIVPVVLNLPVRAVSWPGHVATAVPISDRTGVTIRDKQMAWSIADPTLLGGRVGDVMPQLGTMTPVWLKQE